MKTRSHPGINQRTGKLRKGWRYSGKRLKSGPQIVRSVGKTKRGGGNVLRKKQTPRPVRRITPQSSTPVIVFPEGARRRHTYFHKYRNPKGRSTKPKTSYKNAMFKRQTSLPSDWRSRYQ